MNHSFRKHLSQVSEGMTLLDDREIEDALQVLRVVKQTRGTVYVFGNGGSHATASHMVNDLMKMCRIPAVCIGDSVPTVSAYGNDDGQEHMFSKPLGTLLKPNDCVIGISCGGNSENVVYALKHACDRGDVTLIALTGASNDTAIHSIKLDAIVHAKAFDIRAVEDLHSMVCHGLVRALQEE